MTKRSTHRRRHHQQSQRRGAITVLTAFVLVAILALAGFLLSLSYIQLANSELQVATDAAARSGVIALVISQSEDDGRAAAIDIASRYQVGGNAFSISPRDVTFGNADQQNNGSFRFRSGRSPMNAARVVGKKTAGSLAGTISLPLGAFVGQETIDSERTATAMRLDFDIVLVLDRSGSMGWDLSQDRYAYPASRSQRPLLENYFSPPDPIDSRWGVLSASVDEFLDVLVSRDVSAKVGLVTFAGDYVFGDYESERVTLDSDLTDRFDNITTAVERVGEKPVIGGTDIAAGLLEAQVLLTGSRQARVRTAHPVIVLFSDGIFNEGDDPVALAQSLYDTYGIVIHSVTFGAEVAARQTMNNVAAAGGQGLSLHADNADELVESFREIANSIPVIVTQ